MLYAKPQNIDKTRLQKLLPKGTNHAVTDEIINQISAMEESTGLMQEYLEESLLSHLPVLKEVKVDLTTYVDAIKYCNLKRNMSNEDAWSIVFPDKHKRLIAEGRWNSSHVAMYNGSKIVVKIDAQMMISTHIQYAPMFHASIMKQFNLMNGLSAAGSPVSAMVQHLAAKALADLTAPPIEQKIDIKIGQSDEAKSMQMKTFNAMNEIAKNQRALLEAGYDISQVQRLNLTIEVEEDDGEEEYADILEQEEDMNNE